MDIHEKICDFINFRDIRAHLKGLHYKFTAQEAAWIVSQSRRKTLAEKHTAWWEIIEKLPDCPCVYDGNRHFDSTHDMLRRYMAMQDEWLERFLGTDEGAIYQYRIEYRDQQYDGEVFYSDFEKCRGWLREGIAELDDLGSFDYTAFYVFKHYIDRGWAPDKVRVNKAGDILDLHGNDTDDEFVTIFDYMWFGFPTPFQKGDILWDPERSDGALEPNPVVFLETSVSQYAERERKPNSVMDMYISGYFQHQNGEIFGEVTANYMDYGYYPEEKLVGRQRIMKALSSLLKEEIDVALFAKAYLMIHLQEREQMSRESAWYTEEGMRLAGLIPPEET